MQSLKSKIETAKPRRARRARHSRARSCSISSHPARGDNRLSNEYLSAKCVMESRTSLASKQICRIKRVKTARSTRSVPAIEVNQRRGNRCSVIDRPSVPTTSAACCGRRTLKEARAKTRQRRDHSSPSSKRSKTTRSPASSKAGGGRAPGRSPTASSAAPGGISISSGASTASRSYVMDQRHRVRRRADTRTRASRSPASSASPAIR